VRTTTQVCGVDDDHTVLLGTGVRLKSTVEPAGFMQPQVTAA
jgi:hypothetical protein